MEAVKQKQENKMNTAQAKITKATLKSFIRKNEGNLFVNLRGEFDPSVDGVNPIVLGFRKAESTELSHEHTLGIRGLWLVGGSRNSFQPFNEGGVTGIRWDNSCGFGVVAIAD